MIDVLSKIPNDLLMCISENLKNNDNINLSVLNKINYDVYKDVAFSNYKVDSHFSMKKLKMMLSHIKGIETLTVDSCDIFFIAQIVFPNLKYMVINNCEIKSTNLDIYNNVEKTFINCNIIYG